MKQRLVMLDYIRVFALCGIIFMNIDTLAHVEIHASGSLNSFIEQYKPFLFEQRFFIIFSFLFGIGFYLFLSRAEEKGLNGQWMFFRRLLLLAIFGVVHQLVHPGEALLPYAIFGFMLWPFYFAGPITIFIVSLLCMILGTMYFSMLNILAMFLLGLWVGKVHLFENLDAHMKKLTRIGILALLAAPFVLYLQSEYMRTIHYETFTALSGMVMAVIYVITLLHLLQRPLFLKWFKPLKDIGRMSLTNYILQTVLIVSFIYATGMKGNVTPVQSVIICISVILIQFLFTTLWQRKFRMGPVEWVWRTFTYMKRSLIINTETTNRGVEERHAKS